MLIIIFLEKKSYFIKRRIINTTHTLFRMHDLILITVLREKYQTVFSINKYSDNE